MAAVSNHMEMAQWLVKEGGADVEAKDNVSLACCWSHLTCGLPDSVVRLHNKSLKDMDARRWQSGSEHAVQRSRNPKNCLIL